ncbi:MAG: F0F1 ATP synthase subunit epsilon [Chloroflexi bacterium]|nr:F0F1 ATP synthase subunit epsilon [Chloroflexota bacterium]
MATMLFEMVTVEKLLFSDQVESIVAPGEAGELGILPHHAPLLSILRAGELRVTQDGQEQSIVITGGFLEVLDNKVTVLADAAERIDEIDLERAEIAVRRAEERIASRDADMDLERALGSLRRAQVRVTVGRRRRSRGIPPSAGAPQRPTS